MRKPIAVAVLLLVLLPAFALAGNSKAPVFYARIDVIVTAEEAVELDFGAKSDITLVSATPLPGFTLERFVVIFEGGAPKGVVPIVYDKKSESMGTLTSLVSYSGEVRLSSNGYNGTCWVRMITVQRKTLWVPLQGDLVLDTSEYRDLGLSNVVVRVSIDNYAPYWVTGVLDQQGNDLLSLEAQGAKGSDVVKVDPKHVELKVSKLGFGKYTIKLKQGDEYALPNAMLVVEDAYSEYLVVAKSERTLALRSKQGWKPLGWVIVAYSVAPGPLRAPALRVVGDLVDFAAESKGEMDVRGASLLIPPILLHYWVRAYIVYGATAKIVNPDREDVRVLAIPVYYREVGTWTPQGLEVTVSSKDLGGAYSAFIVVQVPGFARIKSLTLPSGSVVEGYENLTANWGSEWRSLVLEDDEASVQVKNGEQVEEGTYFFSIEWPTLHVKPVDPKGRPVVGAEVAVEGPVRVSAVSGADGAAKVKLYAPGVYRVTVSYRGALVGDMVLATIRSTEVSIACALYDLQVNVKTALGAPVAGALVAVESQSGYRQEMETDDTGRVVFTQLPAGVYTVKAEYKRVAAQQSVTIDRDASIDVNLWILFELPLVGPVTAATAAAAGVVAAVVAGAAFTGRRRREVAEIDLE